jgi:hypothetical protein
MGERSGGMRDVGYTASISPGLGGRHADASGLHRWMGYPSGGS